jgi:hypothetical protein
MPRKKIIITVHGINSDGAWQERVEKAMRPHFQFVNFKYDEYRRWGKLKLFFGPIWGLSAFSAFVMFLLTGAHLSLLRAAFLITLVCLAYYDSYHRRNLLLNRFKREIKKEVNQRTALHDLQNLSSEPTGLSANHHKPHVLSHSLGTFLIGRAIEKFEDIFVDRVILAGCVLPAKFNWRRFRNSRYRFTAIRNEVGKRDLVVWASGAMRWIIVGLGNAGLVGFKESLSPRHRGRILGFAEVSDFLHDVDSAEGPCGLCDPARGGVPVHNFAIKKFSHSDHFVDPEHAKRFWLPFLWGYEPATYWDFRDACSRSAQAEEESAEYELGRLEAEILAFQILPGKSIADFLRKFIRARDQSIYIQDDELDGLVRKAVRQLWKAVVKAEAIEAAQTGFEALELSSELEQAVQSLHPINAARLGAKTALRGR